MSKDKVSRKSALHVDLPEHAPTDSTMQTVERIQPSQVATKLQDLWGSVGSSSLQRACLFNLIIFSDHSGRRTYFDHLVHLVTQKYPCRILRIQHLGENAGDSLHTDVSVEMIGSGSQAVACDQITIEVSASQLHRVPFILLPHIVPDLPVYLMWGQDPTVENEILPRLEQFATRVVFDPGCTTSISHFGSEILRQIGMTGPEILDLTWARVSAWRELIAGMYNSVEDLERLRRSTHIDVIYAHHGCDERLSCSLQALYLQAWLAARLGWSYVSREEPKGRLLIHYQGVTVSLQGMERCDLPLGSLLRIDIHSEDGYHTQLERKKETRQVVIQRSSPALCELPYSVYLSLLTRQHSLLSEIFYQPVGKHYPEMLQTLTKVWQV